MNLADIICDIWEFEIYKYFGKDIFTSFSSFGISSKTCYNIWRGMVYSYMNDYYKTSIDAVPRAVFVPIECCHCKLISPQNYSVYCNWDIHPKRLLFTCTSKICEKVTKFIINNQMAAENILSINSNLNDKFIILRSSGKLETVSLLYMFENTDIYIRSEWKDEMDNILTKDVILDKVLKLNSDVLNNFKFPQWYPLHKKEIFMNKIEKIKNSV